MLKEQYNTYKKIYSNYLIMIKSGSFYICLNDDAIVMNKLLDHKIIETSNQIKTGFPINSLNKILLTLDSKNISYIVVVNNKITKKQKSKPNNYSKYSLSFDIYQIYISRINKISDILKRSILKENINQKLMKIENIL